MLSDVYVAKKMEKVRVKKSKSIGRRLSFCSVARRWRQWKDSIVLRCQKSHLRVTQLYLSKETIRRLLF